MPPDMPNKIISISTVDYLRFFLLFILIRMKLAVNVPPSGMSFGGKN